MHRTLASLALATAFALSGCVTTKDTTKPKPRPLPPPPAGVQPDQLVVFVGSLPEDTDANGFYDTISITLYAFSSRFTTPLLLDGVLDVELTDGAGRPIRTWRIAKDQLGLTARREAPGIGYFLSVSLLDEGTDRYEAGEGRLSCVFTPVGGTPVRPRAVQTVSIGQIR